ncbi:MAG: hypothetical protein WC470_01855 [Candidatus Paceibacterota bacterium]
MEENIFTIEASKIRTMKKDIAAAERESTAKAGGNLVTQKENVINQLEKEKAAIAALAQKEKELEQMEQTPLEEPVLPMAINSQPTDGHAIVIPEKENKIKIKVDKGDSEEEKELKPRIEDLPPGAGLTKTEAETKPKEGPTGLPVEALSSAQEEKPAEMPVISTKETPKDEELGLAIDELEEMEVPTSEEQIDIGEISGLSEQGLKDNEVFESEGQGLEGVNLPIEEPEEESMPEIKDDEIISLNNLKVQNKKKGEAKKEPEPNELAMEDDFVIKEKEEDPKEKMRKITDLIFEIEQSITQIADEKIPFEERKKDIEREIDKTKQRLELIIERKKRIEEIKKATEAKEESAGTPEEKRNMEKERWKVEDERNTVELEKNKKEDEIKSLRLQLNEFNLTFEKILAREKELNMELDLLKRDRDKIIYSGEKTELLTDLEKAEVEANSIKELMLDNTDQKNASDKRLSDIAKQEKTIEEEIKVIEKRSDMAVTPDDLRKLEQERKAIEEKRREIEKKRWETEDESRKIETMREELRTKYQGFAANVKSIKDKISTVNEKLDKNA